LSLTQPGPIAAHPKSGERTKAREGDAPRSDRRVAVKTILELLVWDPQFDGGDGECPQ
jgi:hypothetical protein